MDQISQLRRQHRSTHPSLHPSLHPFLPLLYLLRLLFRKVRNRTTDQPRGTRAELPTGASAVPSLRLVERALHFLGTDKGIHPGGLLREEEEEGGEEEEG